MGKINFRVVAALLVIVAVAYMAFTSVQSESQTGTELSITTSGVITLTNTADEPAAARLTSPRAFTVTVTGAEEATLRSEREGTGRNTVYFADTELPAGVTELRVTRGSDVTFAISADAPMDATAAARDEAGNRSILITAAVVILGALAFMSFATNHSWMKLLRRGGKPAAGMEPSRAA
jgi:hypothetical protein